MWIEELEKYGHTPDEIINLIESYKLIIYSIINAISFLGLEKTLKEKTCVYFNKEYETFAKKYYARHIDYESITIISRFSNVSTPYFKYGLCNNAKETKIFYECLMKNYKNVFGNTCKNFFNIHYNLKKIRNKSNIENINFLLKISKGIKCPVINYMAISNLLVFFERMIDKYKHLKNLQNVIIVENNSSLRIDNSNDEKANSIRNSAVKKYKKHERRYTTIKKHTVEKSKMDFRNVLLEEHKKLKELFDVLKQITNDDNEYYIEDNDNKKLFKWNGTKVLFTVLIMTYLEKQTIATDFWKPFDNAFDSKFRDSAKQYLENLSSDKQDKNLKKANEILKEFKKTRKHLNNNIGEIN
jgi:hypothetical protein